MLLRNILYIFISAALSVACSMALNYYVFPYSVYWLYSILYFAILYFVMNVFYAFKSGSPEFTQLLFGGIVIKLLLGFVIITILSFRITDFFNFALHFILHYILFAIFEIRYLLPLIKKPNASKTNPNEK